MAFVVEDGSGLSTATSWISVADADTYATEVGLTSWTGSSGVKQTALIKAQRYITQVYRGSWKGQRTNETQALDWPRIGAYDVDGWLISQTTIPQALKEAQVELAARALTADLVSDVAAADVAIASESKSVAGISKSVTYVGGKSTQASYPVADMLLAPLIFGSGEIVRG